MTALGVLATVFGSVLGLGLVVAFLLTVWERYDDMRVLATVVGLSGVALAVCGIIAAVQVDSNDDTCVAMRRENVTSTMLVPVGKVLVPSTVTSRQWVCTEHER